MKKRKLITKNLVIDADNVPYIVVPPMKPKKDSLDGDVVKPIKTSLKKLKKAAKAWLNDMIKVTVKKEFALKGWKLGEVKIIFSDPNGNFRYDLFPAYKAKRKLTEKSKEFYKVRDYLHKKHGFAKGVEADDVVAYYVREKGYIGVTADKDLLKGVAGHWYNCHYKHLTWNTISPEQADEFVWCQTLAGDGTDGIEGIFRVGIISAKTLYNGDYSWAKVVEIYESKNLTEVDAILTRRLIAMNQVTVKKDGSLKIKLFEPKKVKHETKKETNKPSNVKKVEKVPTRKNQAGKATTASSKADTKEVTKEKAVHPKRTSTKRKDTSVPKSNSKIQTPVSDNTEGCFIGYYKSSVPHKNIISQSVYSKLSRNAKKEYSEIKA